jgi:poly(3-hydroxyalkanoate) synthetase
MRANGDDGRKPGGPPPADEGVCAQDSAYGALVSPSFLKLCFWPLLAATSAGEASAALLKAITGDLAADTLQSADLPKPEWASPHTVLLDLPTMQLRDFSTRPQGQPALVCAPYALHGASIADFATGHSVVEALQSAGLTRVLVTDWRSATPEMRHFSIDTYLADLNVAIDEIGVPVDLIGLCQGGWMALVYAARFPEKVRRLVLVGAPVDVAAGASNLSRMVDDTPLAVFETLVRLGEGRVLGERVLELWGKALATSEADRVLQVTPGDDGVLHDLERRFDRWYAWTVDLPGTYYLQAVQWLFKENRIAAGRFMALGRTVDLANVRTPLFLLAARDDELVAPEQLFAAARLVGTPKSEIEIATEPCSHLSLFLGARTIATTWRRIGHWLGHDLQLAQAS